MKFNIFTVFVIASILLLNTSNASNPGDSKFSKIWQSYMQSQSQSGNLTPQNNIASSLPPHTSDQTAIPTVSRPFNNLNYTTLSSPHDSSAPNLSSRSTVPISTSTAPAASQSLIQNQSAHSASQRLTAQNFTNFQDETLSDEEAFNKAQEESLKIAPVTVPISANPILIARHTLASQFTSSQHNNNWSDSTDFELNYDSEEDDDEIEENSEGHISEDEDEQVARAIAESMKDIQDPDAPLNAAVDGIAVNFLKPIRNNISENVTPFSISDNNLINQIKLKNITNKNLGNEVYDILISKNKNLILDKMRVLRSSLKSSNDSIISKKIQAELEILDDASEKLMVNDINGYENLIQAYEKNFGYHYLPKPLTLTEVDEILFKFSKEVENDKYKILNSKQFTNLTPGAIDRVKNIFKANPQGFFLGEDTSYLDTLINFCRDLSKSIKPSEYENKTLTQKNIKILFDINKALASLRSNNHKALTLHKDNIRNMTIRNISNIELQVNLLLELDQKQPVESQNFNDIQNLLNPLKTFYLNNPQAFKLSEDENPTLEFLRFLDLVVNDTERDISLILNTCNLFIQLYNCHNLSLNKKYVSLLDSAKKAKDIMSYYGLPFKNHSMTEDQIFTKYINTIVKGFR